MPGKPAASHTGTPRCVSQVAAVWRRVWGVTRPGRPASLTALLMLCFRSKAGCRWIAVPVFLPPRNGPSCTRARRATTRTSRIGPSKASTSVTSTFRLRRFASNMIRRERSSWRQASHHHKPRRHPDSGRPHRTRASTGASANLKSARLAGSFCSTNCASRSEATNIRREDLHSKAGYSLMQRLA